MKSEILSQRQVYSEWFAFLRSPVYWTSNVNYPEKNIYLTNGRLNEMKTVLKFGYPLEGFKNTDDRISQQNEIVFKFLKYLQNLAEDFEDEILQIKVTS
jgi:hypothetical protein